MKNVTEYQHIYNVRKTIGSQICVCTRFSNWWQNVTNCYGWYQSCQNKVLHYTESVYWGQVVTDTQFQCLTAVESHVCALAYGSCATTLLFTTHCTVELWTAFGDRSGQSFWGMILTKYECWALSTEVCSRNNVCFTSHSFLYTQKYLLLLAQTGLVPSPPFSLFLQSFSISLCFFSPSNFVSPVCTTRATFLLADSIRLFHALPFLQCSPRGAIVSQ